MEMSAADMAAVTRPNMYGYGDGFGFGGGSGIWFLALLFLLGGNGFGLRGNGAATTDELSAGFNFSGVNNKLNEISAGISGVNQNLGNAICSSTYELASKIDNTRFEMANYNSGILAAIAADGQKTRDLIYQNKVEALQSQINKLELAQATNCIPRINCAAYGVYPYPTCNTCCNGYTNI